MLDLRELVEERVIQKEKALAMLEENNQCFVIGRLTGKFTFYYKGKRGKYYINTIKISRKSGKIDEIPIIVHERNSELDLTRDYTNIKILAVGKYDAICRLGKLHSSIFAKYVELVEDTREDENIIYLAGNLCKNPGYRKTPNRYKITELFIATNGKNNRSDYIPCIAWNVNAMNAAKCQQGNRVRMLGRAQSRIYNKIDPENKEKTTPKIAYEVSIFKLEMEQE